MKVDIYLYHLTDVLTRNSFPWFVSGSLHWKALTIFTLDNIWFWALGEDGFLRNALLALSPLINDLGHVAWDINTISVVIKKGAHQQYYTAFALSACLFSSSPSLPHFSSHWALEQWRDNSKSTCMEWNMKKGDIWN